MTYMWNTYVVLGLAKHNTRVVLQIHKQEAIIIQMPRHKIRNKKTQEHTIIRLFDYSAGSQCPQYELTIAVFAVATFGTVGQHDSPQANAGIILYGRICNISQNINRKEIRNMRCEWFKEISPK